MGKCGEINHETHEKDERELLRGAPLIDADTTLIKQEPHLTSVVSAFISGEEIPVFPFVLFVFFVVENLLPVFSRPKSA